MLNDVFRPLGVTFLASIKLLTNKAKEIEGITCVRSRPFTAQNPELVTGLSGVGEGKLPMEPDGPLEITRHLVASRWVPF